MLWHYSCIEELCPHFVRKNGFGVPKTIGITALFRFCGLFPLYNGTHFLNSFVQKICIPVLLIICGIHIILAIKARVIKMLSAVITRDCSLRIISIGLDALQQFSAEWRLGRGAVHCSQKASAELYEDFGARPQPVKPISSAFWNHSFAFAVSFSTQCPTLQYTPILCAAVASPISAAFINQSYAFS